MSISLLSRLSLAFHTSISIYLSPPSSCLCRPVHYLAAIALNSLVNINHIEWTLCNKISYKNSVNNYILDNIWPLRLNGFAEISHQQNLVDLIGYQVIASLLSVLVVNSVVMFILVMPLCKWFSFFTFRYPNFAVVFFGLSRILKLWTNLSSI